MANYNGARACFQENVNLIGPRPMADPQSWNLNNGLEQFAAAVQADLAEVHRKLDWILAAIQR